MALVEQVGIGIKQNAFSAANQPQPGLIAHLRLRRLARFTPRRISGVIHNLHHQPGPFDLPRDLAGNAAVLQRPRQIGVPADRVRIAGQHVRTVKIGVERAGLVQHLERQVIRIQTFYLQMLLLNLRHVFRPQFIVDIPGQQVRLVFKPFHIARRQLRIAHFGFRREAGAGIHVLE
ncbi:hypothetical protein D3C75_816820 [compost metagenome]